MKDPKAVKLIASAYDEGRSKGFSEGYTTARDEYTGPAQAEALAQAKFQAYDRGYQRGLAEGQARGSGSENSYNSGLEAGVKAERERALEAEPKLSVWFKPCGKSQFDSNGDLVPLPPGIDKLNGIEAIRQAYDRAEGYGLKEVKGLVETDSYGARYAAGQPLPQSKAVTLYLQLQAAGFDPVLKD